MTDWIAEALREQENQEISSRENGQFQRLRRDALVKGSQRLFCALADKIQENIDEFNRSITNRERSFPPLKWMRSNVFQVKRVYDPDFLLEAEFFPDTPRIGYSVTRPSIVDRRPYKQPGQFHFYLQGNGGALLFNEGYPLTVDEASEILLRPGVEGFIPAALFRT